MPDDDAPDASRAVGFETVLPPLVGLSGLAMAYHPMLLSRFGRIPGESGDCRLIHYLLEHSYRWARAEPIHRAFWDPPFYYPARNVAAHSDVLVGSGLPYWACRLAGAAPDTAFQLWMIAVSSLNYACGYLLFRVGLRFGRPAASASAFLVAFGAPRINRQVHQQLIPCFYVLLAVYALVRIFSTDRPILNPARRLVLWLLAALATAGQLYTGFYQGWFLVWSFGLAGLAALVLPSCRGGFLRVLGRDAWAIVIASVAGGLAIRPLVEHYLQAARELHQGYYPHIPSFWSWLNVGPHDWLWGWTARLEPFRTLPSGIEDQLGIGFITPVVCAAGLCLWRCRVAGQLAGLVLLGWFACVCPFPVPGDVLAASALAVAATGLATLSRERGEPGPRALAASGLLLLFMLDSFPNPLVRSLGLVGVGLAVVEIVRLRDEPRRLIAPGLYLLGLCWPLFDREMLTLALAAVLPAWALAAYARPARRAEARAGAAVGLVAILALLFDLERPQYLAALIVGPPLALAAAARIPKARRPSPWVLAWITVAALPAIVYCYHAGSLWQSISRDVPGATAIRGVGRVMLFMLIPLGVGLAAALVAIEGRWGKALAWSVGVLCLLEQGMTGPTYDKQAQRERVAAISARVDPGCEAFFYHTRRDGSWIAYVNYQLDAMWTSVETGRPTINGYTSVWPRDWIEVRLCAFLPDPDVREALYDWARSRNLDLQRVQWINQDGGPVRFSPFFGSEPGAPEVPGKPRVKEFGLPGANGP